MKPQPETLRRAYLTGHCIACGAALPQLAIAHGADRVETGLGVTCVRCGHISSMEIRTRPEHHARIPQRLTATLEDRAAMNVSLPDRVGGDWDAEELAAMDAVVHWFGD